MSHSPFYRMIYILLVLTLLSACVAPVATPSAAPPTEPSLPPTAIVLPPTDTAVPPTDTPLPPTPTPEPSPTTSALLVEPGKIMGMVDVGGYSLYIKCIGEGSPTIILETYSRKMYLPITVPNQHIGWDGIYENLTKITRTCRYDRANMGLSDNAPFPRTAQDMANDLHALLVNAQIPGPYLLVSAGFGGWVDILYAAQYPEDVAGIVLMNVDHPDEGQRLAAALPAASPNDSASLISLRDKMNQEFSSEPQPGDPDPEGWDFFTSAEQVRAITSLGDIPLLVLTPGYGWNNYDSEINTILNDTWDSLQKELAALSTQGRQFDVEGATFLMWDWGAKPDVIVRQIKQMIQSLQP